MFKNKLTSNSRLQIDTTTERSKEMIQRQNSKSFTSVVMYFLAIIIIIITLPISLLFITKIIPQYSRMVTLRFGKLIESNPKGPGVVFFVPCTDDTHILDLRTMVLYVPPQTVLTKDSVTLFINVCLFFRIVNPVKVLTAIVDYESACGFVAQTAIRNIIGKKYFHDILTEKKDLGKLLRGELDANTLPWGITIERVEIYDIAIPEDMSRALSQESEANRRARAKIVLAEGEAKAAEALKIASDYLNKSAGALQIRYLQTMTNLAQNENTKILFPFPISYKTFMPQK